MANRAVFVMQEGVLPRRGNVVLEDGRKMPDCFSQELAKFVVFICLIRGWIRSEDQGTIDLYDEINAAGLPLFFTPKDDEVRELIFGPSGSLTLHATREECENGLEQMMKKAKEQDRGRNPHDRRRRRDRSRRHR